MLLLIEPISKNIGMYVPAFPLPIMEIASFVKQNLPATEIRVISMPVDIGLPLTAGGKETVYGQLLKEIADLKPTAVGISCTAIAQAEEVIGLSERIKAFDPDIFIFLGGYFPTLYYEEVLTKTSAVDLIVVGEGEIPTLKIVESLERGQSPFTDEIPDLAWRKDGQIHLTPKGSRFDLKQKALIDMELLRYPRGYDVFPYAFSRGCPYKCSFCMEDHIRPQRKEVPPEIVRQDLLNLFRDNTPQTLLVSDALFKSFDLFPFFKSLNIKVNFETRCDVFDPLKMEQIAGGCGALALGFESASYDTLKRMNKIRDRAHYQRYLANARAIFAEAVKHEVPIMVFMIAGFPGDTEADLQESLAFVKELSKSEGPGGYVFKIGECHVYPKTKIYELATSLPGVVFDDDGVFGQNVVRQPSPDLGFKTILEYTQAIFNLSHFAPKLRQHLLKIMPFFRFPAGALTDPIIPDGCYRDSIREVFNVEGESLRNFRALVPQLDQQYHKSMSAERSSRILPIEA